MIVSLDCDMSSFDVFSMIVIVVNVCTCVRYVYAHI